MKLYQTEYLIEKRPPGPPYKAPLPRKKQRTTTRGRSGKPHPFNKEEIFLYKCQQASKLTTWEV